MFDILIDNLTNISFDLQSLILNVFVAFFMGAFLTISYRLTYKGAAPSSDFGISLGMIVIITALIMSVISSNVALSLGLVGALSVIRFRSAVKNIKDATFIFWAVALGLTCGVSEYIYALISSVVILLFLILSQGFNTSSIILLIVKTDRKAIEPSMHFIDSALGDNAKLKMKNVNKELCEMIYEVKYEQLLQIEKRKKFDLAASLLDIEGVLDVNQVGKDVDASL